MKTAYNVKKLVLAEPSLKRNIVPDVKRIENFAPPPWRTQPDALWRDLSHLSVFQKIEHKVAFAKKYFHQHSSSYPPMELIQQSSMFLLLIYRFSTY